MKEEKHLDLFEEYYHTYYKDIYKFCLVKLQFKNEYAEDCAQNVFMTLFRKLSEGKVIENPRAFLYSVANKLLLKEFSDISKNDNDDLICLDSPKYAVNIEDLIDNNFKLEEIKSLLTEEELKLIGMRYEEGYSVEEIAIMLHLSKVAVSKRLYRIRQRIRNEVEL